MDFMHDAPYDGRRFRTLSVVDEGNREGLAIEVGTSIPAGRVIRLMSQLGEIYSKPDAIRLDNGPELTASDFVAWCRARRIALHYIQHGKPLQNAFVERFNRTYREEVLDAYGFASVDEVQRLTDDWHCRYNEIRPDEALGRIPPLSYVPRQLPGHQSSNLRSS
jgi:putative transposase